MVNLSRPWAIIRSPIDLDVVRVLRRTTRPLTGRDVARLVPTASQPTVNAVLRRFAEEGLVNSTEAGNAYLHTFNRSHLAAPALELLADLRLELERRLRHEVEAWEIAPVHMSMFGSAARGDGGTQSDIDIFIVRPRAVVADDTRWREQVTRLSERVLEWTGNHAGVAEVGEGGIRRLRLERPHVVDEIARDAITVSGREAAELLATRR